jgi:uncharacterized protein YjeT (DUF2065 family)
VNDFWAAFALFLVFEGMLPFLAPGLWREAVRQIAEMADGQLRMIGLGSMVAGLALLLMVRG